MRVLIVEDDQDLRDLTRGALETQGWVDVMEATDCASAIEQLGRGPFDLVILDVHLPDGSGLDLLRRVRTTSPGAHALILSGAASEDERVAGLAAGADDYVVKPFSVRELVARITAVHRRIVGSRPTAIDLRDLPVDVGDATIIVVDSLIVAATQAALGLLHATRLEEVVGRAAMYFVAPASEAAAQVRRLRLQAGSWPRPELITIRRLDGDEVLIELASTPVTWHGGLATQMTMWDLSRDTARLRELATGIRSEVTDAVVVANAKTQIQSFNAAAEALYGWRESEVVGRSILDTFSAGVAPDVQAAQEQLFRVGHWHGVVAHRRKDGTPILVSASVTVVKDGADQPVGFVAVNRLAPVATPGHHGGRSDESELIRDVLRGLDHGEFVAHYQPVVRLDDLQWLGVEALARWLHPNRGLLLPAEFSIAFDHPDVASVLGDAILEAACRQAQAWRAEERDLQMAVNLSGQQLTDENLPGRLEELMATTSMPRDTLWLEVTETALVQDLELASQVTRQIDDLGVYLSIDDFGTGWASLTYLRQFDVQALKIDRSFVAELGVDRRAEAIVRSVIELGAELDITVIAEGVETEDQRQRLLQLGCRVGQGYLFGRPQHSDQLDG